MSIEAGKVFIVPETQEAAQVVAADIKPADCPRVVHVINKVGGQARPLSHGGHPVLEELKRGCGCKVV